VFSAKDNHSELIKNRKKIKNLVLDCVLFRNSLIVQVWWLKVKLKSSRTRLDKILESCVMYIC
jgi:hypothetical protein